MKELIEQIELAVKPNADAAMRAAGVRACRAVLAALEAEPGKPLVQPTTPISPISAVAQQLASAPPGLVLDALIAKLKEQLPEGKREAESAPRALRIPFVPLPKPKGE